MMFPYCTATAISAIFGRGWRGRVNVPDRRYIAWGASPIFELYARNAQNRRIDYCVDSAPEKQGKDIGGVRVYPPEKLLNGDRNNIIVINFGHSSAALQSIHRVLSAEGFVLGDNYLDFASFVKDGFEAKAREVFGRHFSENLFTYARSFNFNSVVPLETTVLGNWLLLEALRMTAGLGGSIAEVGAYKGGNSYLCLSAMALWDDTRTYFILDSFRGFDTLSDSDPAHLQDAFNCDYNFKLIKNRFSVFRQSRILRGFVPAAFAEIGDDEEFSVVFFDCDLYKPALDTYNYFWNKLKKRGILIIHDNIATPDGWTGVRKATEEFFTPRGIGFYDFRETTMSVIIKR